MSWERTHKGKLALRLIYACGLAGYLVADTIGDRQPAPRWFASAISEGALLVTISTAVLWIAFEILLHFVRHRGVWATSYAISLLAVLVPGFYLIYAALYGMEQADDSTWHLLALFVVMYQVMASVFTTLAAAAIALVTWIVSATWRASQEIRARTSSNDSGAA